MNHSPENIETEALSLPEPQRAELALKLLDSLEQHPSNDPKQVEKAWLAEANRRYEAYLGGAEQAIPAEQVFVDLRADDR